MVSSALYCCSVRCLILILLLYFALTEAICDHEQVSGVSVLIMANKQDMEVSSLSQQCAHCCTVLYTDCDVLCVL